MNEVILPALTGDTPLGVLAGLGTLRLLNDFTDDSPRLRWDAGSRTAVLQSRHSTVDGVVTDLQAIIGSIADGAVLPGVAAGFPPPGAAPDGLRVAQLQLSSARDRLLSHMSASQQKEAERWLASLVTDLVTDDQGRAAISQFTAPTGKQSMATMLEKPLASIRKEPDYLRQALVSWRRVPNTTGEGLDHRALWDASEDGAGSASMRGVPGATWLALMSFPLFRTTAGPGRRPLSSGWHTSQLGQRRYSELRLPLWAQPMHTGSIPALIEHPALADCLDPLTGQLHVTPALRALSVFHVTRARRYQPPGSQSAGVLSPVP